MRWQDDWSAFHLTWTVLHLSAAWLAGAACLAHLISATYHWRKRWL